MDFSPEDELKHLLRGGILISGFRTYVGFWDFRGWSQSFEVFGFRALGFIDSSKKNSSPPKGFEHVKGYARSAEANVRVAASVFNCVEK